MISTKFIRAVALYRLNSKRKRRRKRSVYVRDIFQRTVINGEFGLVKELREKDQLYHYRYFRMSRESFDVILKKVACKIHGNSTHRFPIAPIVKLSATLRFLATGRSQVDIGLTYKIHQSSITNILRETLSAVCDALEPEYLTLPTTEVWLKSEKYFNDERQFPHAIGAIDGKHVRIKCPSNGGSSFFNYKGFHSVVLLAIVGGNNEFLVVDIGSPGSNSDSGVLRNSEIGKQLELDRLNIPIDNGDNLDLPFVILGDSGFGLKTYLMRPFAQKRSDIELGSTEIIHQKVYNYRLSRARSKVEHAFGMLAARFRIFHSTVNAEMDLITLIIKSTVVLHNFLTRAQDFTVFNNNRPRNINEVWDEVTRYDNGFANIQHIGELNATYAACEIRDHFRDYFVSKLGAVEWQEARVMHGRVPTLELVQ